MRPSTSINDHLDHLSVRGDTDATQALLRDAIRRQDETAWRPLLKRLHEQGRWQAFKHLLKRISARPTDFDRALLTFVDDQIAAQLTSTLTYTPSPSQKISNRWLDDRFLICGHLGYNHLLVGLDMVEGDLIVASKANTSNIDPMCDDETLSNLQTLVNDLSSQPWTDLRAVTRYRDSTQRDRLITISGYPAGTSSCDIDDVTRHEVLTLVKDVATLCQNLWQRGHHIETLGIHPCLMMLEGPRGERRLQGIATGWGLIEISSYPGTRQHRPLVFRHQQPLFFSPEAISVQPLQEGSLVFLIALLCHIFWPDPPFIEPSTPLNRIMRLWNGPWPELNTPPRIQVWLRAALQSNAALRPSLAESLENLESTLARLDDGLNSDEVVPADRPDPFATTAPHGQSPFWRRWWQSQHG